ncbi:MAG TPA: hypothetical protein VGD24_06075 [Gallionella sp.]
MRFKTILHAACSIPLLLAGCGGGHYKNPYDGTWSVVYPVADLSSISATQTVLCNTPPATLVITDGAGTTTQSSTCITTIITATTAGTTTTVYPAQIYNFNISVSIDGNGVVNAIVNGTTFTGQCISSVGCSATSEAGNTLSVTR